MGRRGARRRERQQTSLGKAGNSELCEFIDVTDVVMAKTQAQLKDIRKTTQVWLSTDVLGRLVSHAASSPANEIGHLLHGSIDGNRLLISQSTPTAKPGTATTIDFSPGDFLAASKALQRGE